MSPRYLVASTRYAIIIEEKTTIEFFWKNSITKNDTAFKKKIIFFET